MGGIRDWFDERIDLRSLREQLVDRKMPGGLTWWHTLGSATLAVFMVQVVTGVVLAMYYAPSPDHAYDSVQYLQHTVASGALLHGIHHWGASAMIVLVFAHMIRVFSMGAYKYPREINWLLGVGLLFIVLGFGFTGYLLPWDQKAYWATQVGTNIAGTTPLIGGVLAKLLRGGTQLGATTLTRFYALHVLLFPLLLGGFALLHLALVIRQGIAPRTGVLEAGSPPRTDDPAYPAYYQERYSRSKGAGVRFWPDIIAKDIVVAALVVVVLVALAHFSGAHLDAPADPTDTSYVPRPEWYFLPFFELLRLVPGSLESAIAVGIPAAIVIALLALPFVDRRSMRSLLHRPVAAATLTVLTAGTALLLGAALRGGPTASATNEIGTPLNAIQLVGRTLFRAHGCNTCHAVGNVRPDTSGGAVTDAPDLTEIGLHHSPGWMHSFIEDPGVYHPDSKMPSFGPPKLSHREIEDIAQYLSSLRGRNWATAKPQIDDTFPPPVKRTEHP